MNFAYIYYHMKRLFEHIDGNQFKLGEELAQMNVSAPIPPNVKQQMGKIAASFVEHLKKCNTFEELGSFNGAELDTNKHVMTITVYNGHVMR